MTEDSTGQSIESSRDLEIKFSFIHLWSNIILYAHNYAYWLLIDEKMAEYGI